MTDLKILDAQTTVERLPFEALVNALQDGFANGCEMPVRHHHAMQRSGEPDATLLLMPAWSKPDVSPQYLGVKIVTVVPGNMSRGLPGLVSTYLLSDALTGRQLALLDGNAITSRRTVATSALAARYLSREDSSRLLVLGSGRVASLIPDAYRSVRPIVEVDVWDINQESAHCLVGKLQRQGIRATVVEDLEASVRAADIVSAATLATEPLVMGEWLEPGTHLDLIGGFTPSMREANDEAVRISDVHVDTAEALIEAGDLVQPLTAGAIRATDVRGTLTDLVLGQISARTNSRQITYFKAVGSALADLVAARLVYEGA